jgi:hypothetical protein
MSFNNIKLPDIVIAGLYRQSLIQYDGPVRTPATPVLAEPEPKPAVVESQPALVETKLKAPSPAGYKTLGNNKRHIAIIVDCPQDVFVPEADLQFLTKMLSACKLNMADVAIVNHATAPIAIELLKQQLQPEHVLLFGVEPGAVELPISFPAFKEQAYAGSIYLFTPSLGQLNLENDEAKQQKRKLWDCLKRMFL